MSTPPLGRLYDGLLLHHSGAGRPPVVFLPGAGLTGLDFLPVQRRVAEFTTSVVYDRAGTGWSAPAELPRSAAAVATELRNLLRAAGIPGPYLLAGHSIAGLYARRFAQLFPGEVAGLLLLDPGHEDMYDHLPPDAAELNAKAQVDVDALPELTGDQSATARAQYRQLLADYPEAVREPLIDRHLADWRTGPREAANMESELFPELRDGGPIPDVPLSVVTATGRNPFWAQHFTEEQQRAAHAGIHALHASIAASVSRGVHREVAASHQYPHLQQPDAVVAAVRELLAQV